MHIMLYRRAPSLPPCRPPGFARLARRTATAYHGTMVANASAVVKLHIPDRRRVSAPPAGGAACWAEAAPSRRDMQMCIMAVHLRTAARGLKSATAPSTGHGCYISREIRRAWSAGQD